MTKTPHKHSAAIIAWANGEKIEYRADAGAGWKESDYPAWVLDHEYRVKPARSYPVTAMTNTQLNHAFDPSAWFAPEQMDRFRGAVNQAIRHAIDNGQVVTREEFALAIGDRDKRDMAIAEYVKRACINMLYTHPGQHYHSQTVLEGMNLTTLAEWMKP